MVAAGAPDRRGFASPPLHLRPLQNQFDSIDMSDNAIARLEGFPKLHRLSTLHLNNNRVSRIARNLEGELLLRKGRPPAAALLPPPLHPFSAVLYFRLFQLLLNPTTTLLSLHTDSIPHLEWLILTNNKLSDLADLESLASLPRLKYLSLVDNPVTKQPGYRLFVINRCKKLKVLDFRKVKQAEREEAEVEFGGQAAPAPTAFEPDEELAAVQGKAAAAAEPGIRKGPGPEQVMAIKAAIAAASTLEEVQRLEAALKTGHMPGDVAKEGDNGAAAMEEG